MKTKTCPGREGEKVLYQLPAHLGGDHLNKRQWIAMGKPWDAWKVSCGTCNGTGKVPA
jgi:hypothetical protein